MPSTPARVDLDGLAALLGVRPREARRISRSAGFPAPTDQEWERSAVYGWAAHSGDGMARRVPPRFQPAATTPAAYRGAHRGIGPTDAHVALRWHTGLGEIVLVYPDQRRPHVGPETLLAHLGADVYLVCVVWTDYGIAGPALESALGATGEKTQATWADLHRLLGARAPWWPLALRDGEHMLTWQPGDAPRTLLSPPRVDTTAWLRAALLEPPGSTVATVLSHLAAEVHHRSGDSTDMRLFSQCKDREHIAVAAVPLAVPEPGPEPTEAQRRAAWLEILEREDELAIDCASAKSAWDSGSDTPYPYTVQVLAGDGPYSAAWIERLEPAPRTAGHVWVAGTQHPGEEPRTYLRDAATDIPAVRAHHPGENTTAHYTAAPFRLSTTAALAAVVLEGQGGQVWVRTDDDALHLAPRSDYAGISWGYSGSGPSTLAHLVSALLDDITAPATNAIGNAPPALEALFERCPQGAITVLEREELLAARGH